MDFFNSAVTNNVYSGNCSWRRSWCVGRHQPHGRIRSRQPCRVKSQGVKQLMAGGGVMLLGLKVVPLLSSLITV